MLSRKKHALLAAAAALALLFSANATMTSANAQGQPTQIEKKQDGQNNRQGESREVKSKSGASSNLEVKSSRDGRADRQLRSDRSRETIKTRTVVRHDNDRVRNRIVIRDRDHDGWRGQHSYAAVTFVILGPRHHYRPGWCRGLHRGKHWAPGMGWHAGRHVGLFRC